MEMNWQDNWQVAAWCDTNWHQTGQGHSVWHSVLSKETGAKKLKIASSLAFASRQIKRERDRYIKALLTSERS